LLLQVKVKDKEKSVTRAEQVKSGEVMDSASDERVEVVGVGDMSLTEVDGFWSSVGSLFLSVHLCVTSVRVEDWAGSRVAASEGVRLEASTPLVAIEGNE
jgi:hypothetical protein